MSTLNHRNELTLTCRHSKKFLLNTVIHHHHHHIQFYIHFTCWHALDGFQKIDLQANLSLARSLLTLLSLKPIFITSSHVFFGLPLPNEPDTSTALHLLTQKLLSILSM